MSKNANIVGDSLMDAETYQLLVQPMRQYADANSHNVRELGYLGLGISGEAGEFADQIKKIVRDPAIQYLYEVPAEVKEKLILELGDVMWYIAVWADVLGVEIGDIMQANLDKLNKRHAEGRALVMNRDEEKAEGKV